MQADKPETGISDTSSYTSHNSSNNSNRPCHLAMDGCSNNNDSHSRNQRSKRHTLSAEMK